MSDYEINEFGEIIRNNDFEQIEKSDQDKLFDEYSQLEYLVLNNHINPTDDSEKVARYYELKSLLGMDKQTDVFKVAKEKIKKKADNTSGLTNAIKRFKQNNG